MKARHKRAAATAAVAAIGLAGYGASTVGAKPVHGRAASGTTLTVWTYYTGAAQIKALKQQDALFEKQNPGVTVDEVQVPGTQLDPKLLAAAAAHTGPDVFLDNVVVDFPELVAAGALSPLTSDWNSYSGKSQYPAAGIWKSKGQIYNVMSYSNLLGLYYNKSILKQYKLSPPKTITQWESDMAVIAKAGKYTPLAASADNQPDGAWTWYPTLLDHGVTYCNTTATKMEPMFQQVADWTKSGYLPQAAATWTQTDSWTQFMSGKYAFGINGNWNLGDAKSATFPIGTAELPTVNGQTHVFPGGEGLGIGGFSKNKALDWKYLEDAWLSQKASEIDFTDSGQIPTRADVANTSVVKKNANAAPFVAATKTVSAWPRNPKTDQMQLAVATQLSDVVSGQATPAQAAASAAKSIAADIKAGGGAC
jgi:multiple sugar transport system substrate-binding protein